MLRYQKAGQKHSIKIANRAVEDLAKLKYLGTTLTDENFMCTKRLRAEEFQGLLLDWGSIPGRGKGFFL
jgi:hypothetical protein